MTKYLVYLHSIWFSHKNLFSFFENNANFQDFFEKLSFEALNKFKLKDEKIFEIMANHKIFDYNKIDTQLETEKINIVTINDENYPDLLKTIPNPPFFLYIKWNLRNNINLLSIVWSRKNTRYSQTVLESIIPNLINNNFWIVSWWAYWVDSLAHNITIKNNWYTVSVIWTWIDNIYPSSNKAMYENITTNWWAIVSIFRLWTWPEPYNFPIRNEIIAWLSKWTIITEAWEKSWTLITAQLALELNRDVFVVPWDINRDTSLGANKLIRDWLGKLILSCEDILDEYNMSSYWVTEQKEEKKFSDEIEQKIYNELLKNPLDASSLWDKLNIDIEIIGYKLSIMEICGHIELWKAGNYYIK